MEWYKKHRPKLFKQIVDQNESVSILETKIKDGTLPHAILLSGPSGTGKTTLARVLKEKLKCSDVDFHEINCADFRGIDTIREIRQRMNLSPLNGDVKIWLIDECHQTTSTAQDAMLKMLEDTPSHVYFFLATTEPQKLIATIHTRCTHIKLRSLSPTGLEALLRDVTKKEGVLLTDAVIERIVEVADGSARKAIVIAEQVSVLEDEETALETIARSDQKDQAITIARMLFDKKTQWKDLSKVIQSVDGEVESIRHLILGYATKILLGGGAMAGRAYLVIQSFRDAWYDCKKAGLAVSCYDVFKEKI